MFILVKLYKEGKKHLADWVQQSLLDILKSKRHGIKKLQSSDRSEIFEPIPYYFNCKSLYLSLKSTSKVYFLKTKIHFSAKDESTPMIAWNEEQEEGFESETFRRLLLKLGFEVHSRNSQFPICIPANDWPIHHLLFLAERFGPIPEDEKPSAFM